MFIKITDEDTALRLAKRGFLFTKEKVGKDTLLFCFEKTADLDAVLSENYSSIKFIEEDTMRFGGEKC